jgi:hypothetical protein
MTNLEAAARLGMGGEDGQSRKKLVGAEGFEPPTLCSQSRCATRLRYAPILGLYRNQGVSGVPGEPLQEPKDEEDRG